MPGTSGRDTIRRVCAWCGVEMGPVAGHAPHRYPVTHGICKDCSHILSNFKDVSLDQLIDKLDGPVMAVDDISGEVVAATAGAAEVFGKSAAEMVGLRGGVVMECVHSTEPGGCGNTVHCSGCSIRRLVSDTASSGVGVDRTPTYQYRVTSQGIRMQHYLISTEKIDDLILLRIEPGPVGDEARPE